MQCNGKWNSLQHSEKHSFKNFDRPPGLCVLVAKTILSEPVFDKMLQYACWEIERKRPLGVHNWERIYHLHFDKAVGWLQSGLRKQADLWERGCGGDQPGH